MTLLPGFLLASEPHDLCTGRAGVGNEAALRLGVYGICPPSFFSASAKARSTTAIRWILSSHKGAGDGWQPARKLHAGSTAGIRNRHPAIHLLTPAILPTPTREIFRGGQVIYVSREVFAATRSCRSPPRGEVKKWNEAWASGGEWSLPARQERTLIVDLGGLRLRLAQGDSFRKPRQHGLSLMGGILFHRREASAQRPSE